MSDSNSLVWFGARTYFTINGRGDLAGKIDEVVFVLRAHSLDDALERAFEVADRYAQENNYATSEYDQVYEMIDDSPYDGAEVFSFIHRNYKGTLEDMIDMMEGDVSL